MLTEHHLQLAANFISLQESLVNLKHHYELHSQLRSWWSWKKIRKEIQQGKQRVFPFSFPREFLSLSPVKAWPRHCSFWPVHPCGTEPALNSDPGHAHRYLEMSLLLTLLLPFLLWISNERKMLLPSEMVDSVIFNDIPIFILNLPPFPSKKI